MYQIGQISRRLSLSTDTLRYYEKIKLLPAIARNASGLRQYSDSDVSIIKFIKRAQKMKFSLDEIGQLLNFRKSPIQAQPDVRKMAHEKLQDISTHIQDLTVLKNELQLLVNLCTGDKDHCPILDGFEEERH